MSPQKIKFKLTQGVPGRRDDVEPGHPAIARRGTFVNVRMTSDLFCRRSPVPLQEVVLGQQRVLQEEWPVAVVAPRSGGAAVDHLGGEAQLGVHI